jgi:pyruvate/2-oxoglutarate dehydrogenase complex dihydrolipoamide dehydrogenase (E3) component
MRQLFKMAGLEPAVKVVNAETGQEVACVEVWRYKGRNADYVALIRNSEFRVSELGQVGYSASEAIERAERVRVTFPFKARVRNILTGRNFGVTDVVVDTLEPWAPLIFELRKGE